MEDIGQAFNDFWTEYGPIIISVVSSGSFGTIIMAIVSAIVKGATKKINTATTTNITDEQMNAIAKKFAGYVSSKVFNVDISKLLTDEVTAQLSTLTSKVENEVATAEMSNAALSVIALALSRSKLLSESERKTLADASTELANKAKPKEQIQVEVVAEEEKAADNRSLASF